MAIIYKSLYMSTIFELFAKEESEKEFNELMSLDLKLVKTFWSKFVNKPKIRGLSEIFIFSLHYYWTTIASSKSL